MKVVRIVTKMIVGRIHTGKKIVVTTIIKVITRKMIIAVIVIKINLLHGTDAKEEQ